MLAIFYIGGLYAIYAVHIEGGFVYVARATALSVLVIVAARVLAHSIRGLSRRGFAISPQLQAQFPTLEQRANRYVPILTGLASTVLYVVAGLSVLQAWEVSAFAWLDTDLARRLGGDLLSIGLIVAAALAVWEIFASAIERYLSKIDGGVPRRTRVRTLLPLLRTAMLSLIVVMSALIILSHLGIDIAPLLAGAGVVGVAIGFGSQALVKDVITGLFILLEDQLAVGDIVDVGKDHAGVVEAISVRTIRLRDQSGTVHTVPFSEVMTVKNMTREYAYVAARVTIAYGEDIDRVVEILRAASTELMEDETLRDAILDPFEYLGVDALNDSSVVLLGPDPDPAGKAISCRPRLQPAGQDCLRQTRHRLARPFAGADINPAGGARRNRPRSDAARAAAPRLRRARYPRSGWASASTASISLQASTRRAICRLNPARAKAARSRV